MYIAKTLAVAVFTPGVAFAQVTVPPNAGMNLPTGSTLGLACTSLGVSGTVNLGASQIERAAGVQINAGGALGAGTGTLSVSGDWVNNGSFDPGTGTVAFDDACAGGPIAFLGATVFNNLTLSSLSGRTFVLPQGSNITVNGTLTLQGTPAMPIQLASSGGSTAVVNLGPGALVMRNNAQVAANVQIGALAHAGAVGIPTLSEWGRIGAAALLSLAAAIILKRRREHA
ncbi:IPTL-CTERM sorting domain-containing protein [Acidovorax sp.]|uniref:IPTL-CTERM sorting domain-containing protein n=1 Tax=Acidovorax sp. TaxID=1872122 RepID=UPI00391CD15F